METPADVRRARTGDVPALIDLRAHLHTAMGVPDVDTAPWREAAADWLRRAIMMPEFCVIVAERDGHAVSCALGRLMIEFPSPLNPSGRAVQISNISTAPGYRHQGLASSCIDAVIGWGAAVAPGGRCEVYSSEDAHEMYAKRGFTGSPFPHLRRRLN